MGGKSRIRKQLARIVQSELGRRKGAAYVEPFCGYCWVAEWVQADRRILADIHPQLIAMWKALQTGWEPPKVITPEIYRAAQFGHKDAATTGFIGFAHSFAGRYFQGLARDVRGSAETRAKLLSEGMVKRAELFKAAEFSSCSYEALEFPKGSVVYADPPYVGAKGYVGTPVFDHERFWDWVRHMSKKNLVLVSEYKAPPDFEQYAGFLVGLEMRDSGNRDVSIGVRQQRTERLWRLRK